MKMFMRGGTLTELGSRTSPRARSVSYGTWRHADDRAFTAVFRFSAFNIADNPLTGTQTVRRTIVINRAGDAFTATAASGVVDANDMLIRAGCATETATRLE